jgi:hypothetical protein
MQEIKRCKRCGNFIDNSRKKYCLDCAIIVDKEKGRIRQKRYRERHNNQRVKQWVKEHPEQRKLHARNYIRRHPEEHKARLYKWRKENPEKRKQQYKKSWQKFKARQKHMLYQRGYRKKVTEPGRIEHCVICGKEVISQKGQKNYKRYCDKCILLRNAEISKQCAKKFKAAHPTYDRDYMRNKRGVIVAVTCIVCGDLILYDGKGRVPYRCDFCNSRMLTNQAKKFHEHYYRINKMETDKFINYEKKRIGLWTTK